MFGIWLGFNPWASADYAEQQRVMIRALNTAPLLGATCIALTLVPALARDDSSARFLLLAAALHRSGCSTVS
jgi:hypothetical protein